MVDPMFNQDDLSEFKARGIALEKIYRQIDAFKRGFPPAKLLRPCIRGDSINVLNENDLKRLNDTYSEAASHGRALKFVPASGAASRMFKTLLAAKSHLEENDENTFSERKELLEFIEEIKSFAFYEKLAHSMSKDGLDIEDSISNGDFRIILEYILNPTGLNLANIPKGLIPFHKYEGFTRTPFEEHMVEASVYAKNGEGVAKIHFTVSPEHENQVKEHIRDIKKRIENKGIRYEVGFSNQKFSTDTIAVDMDNNPFRDDGGKIVFRPGGHGALLENLNEFEGDIVFLKNIDNVVPERLKQVTYTYKKALGGYLVELQNTIFGYIERLLKEDSETFNQEVSEFIRKRLSYVPNVGKDSIGPGARENLISRLNRPIRVCGMVRNESEPGGGPFWVKHENGAASIQIVETSQIDMEDAEQKAIFESSTHFNPVDLVCGVRDYEGKPFDLDKYVDHDTGFISIKSKDGRELKALELPGLWNGSMAFWNTVFVEVPLITFNPVKTVFDLLREEHQPE